MRHSERSTASLRAALDLALISFACLYFEMIVVRWLASDVRVFAYLKNLPLLAAFLGLGLGCIRGGGRLFRVFPALCLLFATVIAFAGPLGLVHLYFPQQDFWAWNDANFQEQAWPTALLTAEFFAVVLALFFLVVALFCALGERLGAQFDSLAANQGVHRQPARQPARHLGCLPRSPGWAGRPAGWFAVGFLVLLPFVLRPRATRARDARRARAARPRRLPGAGRAALAAIGAAACRRWWCSAPRSAWSRSRRAPRAGRRTTASTSVPTRCRTPAAGRIAARLQADGRPRSTTNALDLSDALARPSRVALERRARPTTCPTRSHSRGACWWSGRAWATTWLPRSPRRAADRRRGDRIRRSWPSAATSPARKPLPLAARAPDQRGRARLPGPHGRPVRPDRLWPARLAHAAHQHVQPAPRQLRLTLESLAGTDRLGPGRRPGAQLAASLGEWGLAGRAAPSEWCPTPSSRSPSTWATTRARSTWWARGSPTPRGRPSLAARARSRPAARAVPPATTIGRSRPCASTACPLIPYGIVLAAAAGPGRAETGPPSAAGRA